MRYRSKLFTGMSPEECINAEKLGRLRDVTEGEVLYSEGTHIDAIFLVVTGSIKMTKISQCGTEVTVRTAHSGSILSASHFFTSQIHGMTAEAIENSKVISWYRDAFKIMMREYPAVYRNVIRMIADDLHDLESRFHEIITKDTSALVASQLIRLMRQTGCIEIKLSREEIGQMVGSTLYTVSRIYSEWHRTGIIKAKRKSITVLDINRLLAISESQTNEFSNSQPIITTQDAQFALRSR